MIRAFLGFHLGIWDYIAPYTPYACARNVVVVRQAQSGKDLCGWLGVTVSPMTAAFADSLSSACPYLTARSLIGLRTLRSLSESISVPFRQPGLIREPNSVAFKVRNLLSREAPPPARALNNTTCSLRSTAHPRYVRVISRTSFPRWRPAHRFISPRGAMTKRCRLR